MQRKKLHLASDALGRAGWLRSSQLSPLVLLVRVDAFVLDFYIMKCPAQAVRYSDLPHTLLNSASHSVASSDFGNSWLSDIMCYIHFFPKQTAILILEDGIRLQDCIPVDGLALFV